MSPSTTSKKKSEDAGVERITLTTLAPAPGSTHPKKRVGRGRASGMGKTSTRGHNGQGQRAGNSAKRGFEGGQMPLFRRLPHIGAFRQPKPLVWLELNVGELETLIPAGQTEVTYELLASLKSFNPNQHDGVRLMGNGELKRKLSITAHYASPSARQKIEAAGGQITLRKPAVPSEASK